MCLKAMVIQAEKSKKSKQSKDPICQPCETIKKKSKKQKRKQLGVCRWLPRFATSGGAYRRIQMWAHPLRKAKKANKAKIPYENHAKPFRKS